MSYNIRLDVESDGVNQWNNRKEGIVSLIKEEKPDILGIQEGLEHQIKYLSNQLDEYSMIGEGRDGGKSGEYSAIYYKNKKLTVLTDQTFWLSETPSIPSIGWDAALNRVSTVGVFRIISSNEKLIAYNTHFDHIGIKARDNSVNVILNHIKDNNFTDNAIIVMGDLNASPDDKIIQSFTKIYLDAAVARPQNAKQAIGTFNGFDLEEPAKRRIDYIFLDKANFRIESYLVPDKPQGHSYPSDHFPVIVDVKLAG